MVASCDFPFGVHIRTDGSIGNSGSHVSSFCSKYSCLGPNGLMEWGIG